VAKKQRPWGETGRLFLLAVLLTPLTIFIHELGHFAIPIIFDLPAQLHPTTVSGGAEPGSGASGWMVAAQAGGGPLATVLMAIAGGSLFSRNRKRLWALAAAVAAASRMLVTTGYLAVRLLLAVLGTKFGGTPNFDEHNVAAALGFSPVIISIAASGFLALLLFWMFRRMESGSRILFALALGLGIGLGGFAWTTLAPPVLATIS
jgi:hypothetical protein